MPKIEDPQRERVFEEHARFILTSANDLGLYSGEYDPRKQRQLGNIPVAFTHVAMINTAQIIGLHEGASARQRYTIHSDARMAKPAKNKKATRR